MAALLPSAPAAWQCAAFTTKELKRPVTLNTILKFNSMQKPKTVLCVWGFVGLLPPAAVDQRDLILQRLPVRQRTVRQWRLGTDQADRLPQRQLGRVEARRPEVARPDLQPVPATKMRHRT